MGRIRTLERADTIDVDVFLGYMDHMQEKEWSPGLESDDISVNSDFTPECLKSGSKIERRSSARTRFDQMYEKALDHATELIKKMQKSQKIVSNGVHVRKAQKEVRKGVKLTQSA